MGRMIIQFQAMECLVDALMTRLYGEDYLYVFKDLKQHEIVALNDLLNEYLSYGNSIYQQNVDALDLTIISMIKSVEEQFFFTAKRMAVRNIRLLSAREISHISLLDPTGAIIIEFSE